MAKRQPKPVSKPSSKPSIIPLLVAGAVGFFAAILIMKSCPMSSGCPMYSEACPVTTTLAQVEADLQKGNLSSAQSSARKLTNLLEPTMPELAKQAELVARSNTLAEAKSNLAKLDDKIMASMSPLPNSAK